MVKVNPEFIVDSNEHKKAVVLSIVEWESIVEELEELDDIRAYDLAKSQSGESVPFDQAVDEIEKGFGS